DAVLRELEGEARLGLDRAPRPFDLGRGDDRPRDAVHGEPAVELGAHLFPLDEARGPLDAPELDADLGVTVGVEPLLAAEVRVAELDARSDGGHGDDDGRARRGEVVWIHLDRAPHLVGDAVDGLEAGGRLEGGAALLAIDLELPRRRGGEERGEEEGRDDQPADRGDTHRHLLAPTSPSTRGRPCDSIMDVGRRATPEEPGDRLPTSALALTDGRGLVEDPVGVVADGPLELPVIAEEGHDALVLVTDDERDARRLDLFDGGRPLDPTRALVG